MDKISFSIEKFDLMEISQHELMKVRLWIVCEGNNRHNMPIPWEAIEKAKPTLVGKPIVAKFDKFKNDLLGHEKDEIAVGVILSEDDIDIKTDEEGKRWLVANGIIWTRYAQDVAFVLDRDKIKNLSMEIVCVETGEKDSIQSFVFSGITLIGVTPAIPNARVELLSFSKVKEEIEQILSNKYNNLDFSIPEKIKENVQNGLELHKKLGKGGNSVSLTIAKYLINNSIISPEKVKYILKYFSRHIDDDLDDKTSNNWITRLLYGGNEGLIWLNNLMNFMSSKNNKNKEQLVFSNIEQENKKEDEEMEFAKTPEMFAKIKEFCNGMKYSKDEKEYSKFAVASYDEKYVYALDKEENKFTAIPYTYSDEKFEADMEGKKFVKVKMSFEVPNEDTGEEDDFSVMMSLFTTDANLEPAAQVARSEKETEGDKEVVDEMSAKIEEMSVKMSALESENKELKEFKNNILEQEKDTKVQFALTEVSETTMPKEKIEEWKNKVVEFVTIDAWVNALKADAFNYVKGKEQKDGFVKMGLPYQTEFKKTKKSVWED